MPKLSIGPVDIRYYAGLNWSNFELTWVTARTHGFAQRETALRCSFKSEHLLELCGAENLADQITINGANYCGRHSAGPDGVLHTLTAAQVAARAQRIVTMRRGLSEANRAAVNVTGDVHYLTTQG